MCFARAWCRVRQEFPLGAPQAAPSLQLLSPCCGRQGTQNALVPFRPTTSRLVLSDPPRVPPPVGGAHSTLHASLGIRSASSRSLCVAPSVPPARNPLGVRGHP